jgi:predicted DNA-binding protein
MAKVAFSARKDPLLRSRRGPADEPSPPRRAASAESLVTDQPEAGAGGSPESTKAQAVEGPAGVVAVAPARPWRRRSGAAPVNDDAKASGSTTDVPRPARSRDVARRVQTSISLPPDIWDVLDELGQQAGVSVGELLTAVLAAEIPDAPQAMLSALEQLLVSIPSDEGPHEERNYRLPRELRTRLDELARALGAGPRMQRSMLIRAILAVHLPPNGEQARELITMRRLDAMRAAIAASSMP